MTPPALELHIAEVEAAQLAYAHLTIPQRSDERLVADVVRSLYHLEDVLLGEELPLVLHAGAVVAVKHASYLELLHAEGVLPLVAPLKEAFEHRLYLLYGVGGVAPVVLEHEDVGSYVLGRDLVEIKPGSLAEIVHAGEVQHAGGICLAVELQLIIEFEQFPGVALRELELYPVA